MSKKLITIEIRVNPRDEKRCSFYCQHISKVRGKYTCLLFGGAGVHTGDDDEIGYGFYRLKNCIESEIIRQETKANAIKFKGLND